MQPGKSRRLPLPRDREPSKTPLGNEGREMFVSLFGGQAILERSRLPNNGIGGVAELPQLLPVERDSSVSFRLVALDRKLVLLHECGELVRGSRSLDFVVAAIWVEVDSLFPLVGRSA